MRNPIDPFFFLHAAAAAVTSPAPRTMRDYLPADWKWLDQFTLVGNELWRVVGLFGAILLGLLIGRILRVVLTFVAARWAARNRRLLSVAFLSLARSVVFLAVVLGLSAGMGILQLHPSVRSLADTIDAILFVVALGYVTYSLVDVADAWLGAISARTASKLDDMLVPLVSKSLRGTIIVLAIAQVATYLSDKPVTSIIAGLGVGGLAVGLAAQDTVKNFFGSLMIFGDRPFELGDTINVDSQEGTVEAVGFRSTRFRTGDGYLVTIPNGELANKTIINISKRARLSRKLTLNLTYDTPPEKIERAVGIVRDVLREHEGQPQGMPPRVTFSDFTPAGLVLAAQYWYSPPDVWQFAEFNQKVNFEILRRLAAEGIQLIKPPAPVPPPDAAKGAKA